MAVYMNAKGTTNASFQIGKRGNKIFGGTVTPSSGDVSTGDLWFDNSNSLVRIATVSGNVVSWAEIIQADSSVSLDDLTVSGNLTVQGTTTTINTQTLNVEDNIITLNSNFSGADNIVDAGIEVERGDEPNVQLLWDESEGEWTLGNEFLTAGGFTGNVTGDLVGSVRPNGGPNSVTANTITTSGTLNVTGATITGANTDSISEGSNLYYTDARADARIAAADTDDLSEGSSNLYYTDERVDDRVGAIMAGAGAATVTYDDANATITVDVSGLGVDDFATTNFDATGDTWSDDDSTFATTAAIADRIDAQITSSADIVHITGTETITGDKTISGATLTLTANSTLDVSNATVTGANTDSISEGSTNLYFTNPRARSVISVVDNSTAGNEISYNSATGTITWEGTDAGSPGGSNTQIQFNDDGAFGGHANLTFNSSSETLNVSNLNVTNFTYQILSEDYGDVGETTLVTKDFGNITADASGEYMTNLTDDETPQLAGNLDAQNNNIDNIGIATAKSYKDTVYTITDGASVDIDPDNGGIQVWTLGANRSPTATNFDAGAKVMLMIDDGSSYSVTWPSVNWVGGVAPTLPTSGYGIVELWKVGAQLYGAFAGGVA